MTINVEITKVSQDRVAIDLPDDASDDQIREEIKKLTPDDVDFDTDFSYSVEVFDKDGVDISGRIQAETPNF